MSTTRPEFEAHNQYQRQYFDNTLKRTMVPRATPYVQRQVNEAMRSGHWTPTDRVLEVGCGMGRYTLPLAERGVRVEGLDLSPVLLERLREFNAGRFDIPLYAADLSAPPAQLLGQYDLVLGFFMLHHLHSLDECFAGLARLLKPGGRVVFLEPNPFNPLYYAQILLTPRMTWRAERGMLQMRRTTLAQTLARHGFINFTLRRFGFFPPLLANQGWGAPVERVLERVPLWRGLLPFQIFSGELP
ncbi:MAG: class I SAM-dependent methyltransferase [Acidobacteria bacterium]|nr:class I SAM-dependent methyltransferase [Acidobacteriota bacterium]MBI3423764.1 class I SAM-dependent methyltransferase [Acidobacteriota bacterium]